ncbi:hypothetical protein OUZ56_033656 [Daphnia magna]|uniref:Uncharacterized protein n=1 Tax=Daphnia magna TaxID=35525 RepID=A0ABQ9ZY42_9CRUS|nr:hypothetical protein OUZ56_033656 [Daphnia magna]
MDTESVLPEEQTVSGILCGELATRPYPIGNFLNGVRAPSNKVILVGSSSKRQIAQSHFFPSDWLSLGNALPP